MRKESGSFLCVDWIGDRKGYGRDIFWVDENAVEVVSKILEDVGKIHSVKHELMIVLVGLERFWKV